MRIILDRYAQCQFYLSILILLTTFQACCFNSHLCLYSLYSVQVRRTDKINTEAAFHSIDEYMVHVEEWYHLYGMNHKLDKKRVFIATDDPGVIKEARTKSVCVLVHMCHNIQIYITQCCITFMQTHL